MLLKKYIIKNRVVENSKQLEMYNGLWNLNKMIENKILETP